MIGLRFCVPPLLIAAGLQAADPNAAIFRDKIQPTLQTSCASCHSGATPAGALSVADLASVLAGGKHGPAIAPGHAAESLLIQYVRGEKSPRMPMGGAIPDSTVAALVSAIDQMAPARDASKTAANPYATWLFSKPAAPAIPAVKSGEWVQNPIDAFVLAKLEARNLTPAPPASKRALLRRVYFDLIGLPPTPGEMDQFLSSADPQAYEKIVDRLLADPRYGERWGRHWLDLVRFAESDGFAIDGERPTAWRYRDYVIRSFNQDKPYDTFIEEQLAGDEMEQKGSDRLVALGLLRMGTWEADANFKTQLRQDFLNEVTSTTAQAFLGLTVGCARCHDHKYDPIPQRDFYRMQAFFAATRVDERPAPFTAPEDPRRMKKLMRQYEDEAEAANAELKTLEEQMKQKYAGARHLKPGDKAAAEYAKALKDKKDLIFSAEDRKQYTEAKDRARRVTEAALRYRPVAYAVSEVTPPQVPEIAATYVLAGGDIGSRGEKVEPGFLKCIAGKSDPADIPFAGGSSGRRLALARWIASRDNPLTARVMVNRLWQHHFGEGLARTPSDLGLNGDRPSHPELLDWLATQFIEKKWSVKAMHRLMLTSHTYRQATEHPEWRKYAGIDSSNKLLWRMNWLRLESEAIRDSILAISGDLQKADGGPGVYLNIAPDVAEGFEFFKWFPSSAREQNERTVYTFQRRSVVMPMMEVFDTANMSESCSRRNVTTVAPQAFELLNSEFARTESRRFAERVVELAGPDKEKQIDRAFWLALGRPPSPGELEKARTVDLSQVAVVLFNLNEFLYLE